jgi:2,4-dienoyl-CoA reductase-like NADH-dependent reductase (Old Yellow Enzyme family)
MAMNDASIFSDLPFASGLNLRNRLVMPPMTTWSADDDGSVSDAEIDYYRARVQDVGLVITGCTHVQANGVGFTGEFAAYDDAFLPGLTRLATAAKSGGAPAILQIFHAGVKTSPDLSSDIVAASAVPADAGLFTPPVTPRALSGDEVVEVVAAFGAATRRAIEAGFDGVELHGAHAFLLQNFVSPHTNRRSDQWGGPLENRLRFPLAVVGAVRAAAKLADRPFVVGYRVSPDEPHADGLRLADTLVLVDRLIGEGIDYIHVSLPDALHVKAVDNPDGPTVLEEVTGLVADRVPVIASGRIRTPGRAEQVIAAGASLVGVGQGLVMNPDWVALARQGRTGALRTEVAAEEAPILHIPAKLWTVIENTPGWFAVRAE